MNDQIKRFALVLLAATAPTCAAEEVIEDPIVAADREHWAFQSLKRPDVPPPVGAAPSRNPIDRFIDATLAEHELKPLSQADRTTLIRRLTFDLLGLPPTPEDVDRFFTDESVDAYEQLVDQLLASPHYGERWAQHWLDLARFAETDGFEFDSVRPGAWRYRDWVIDALNRDMPYDRFVQLQLAGDELERGDRQARVATSFCLTGPDMPDINSMEERKHNLLNELTSTVGSVLLGLQLGCAQCHDHKFDPISQADFYRLRAVFVPAVNVQKKKSVSVLNEQAGKVPDSHLMIRGSWQRRGPKVAPAFPRIANPSGAEFSTRGFDGLTTGRRTALARWLTRDDHLLTSRVIVNRIWQYHFGHGLSRSPSDFGLMGEEPTHHHLLDWLATELVRKNWSLKSIHRLILTSATYRRASRAATPESRRSLEVAIERDPKNTWLARFPRRRLEGEAIRDAMLAAGGVLNTRQGGAGVRPPLPKELLDTLLRNQWNVSPNRADHDRRSIYIFARRNLRYPIFEAFDRPDANASCPRRSQSTTAPQSLLLLNSELSLRAARQIAGHVLSHSHTAKDSESICNSCFRRVLSRPPTKSELTDAMEFVASQNALLKTNNRDNNTLALPDPRRESGDPYFGAALVDFCLALLNSNEFIYVD